MSGVFITGTDTGVGKTFVGCALARRALELGLRVFAFKPVETGCMVRGGKLVGDDQDQLVAAAGEWQEDELRGVYQLRRPASPLAAAVEEGQVIDLDRICDVARKGAARADLVIVEGAGGWRVPLTADADMSQLAARTCSGVIVVGRAGLGTINHSLLTIEAVERDQQRVQAVVLSRTDADDPAFAAENAAEIQRRWPGRVIVYDRSQVTALDELIRVPRGT